MNDEPKGKGVFNRLCNRSSCLAPHATWFNHSTLKYYCTECAFLINQANTDAVREFGHKLCTPGRNKETK